MMTSSGTDVSFLPSGHQFTVIDGETVVEAASRLGYKMAYACANGVCRICKATLLSGTLRSDNRPLLSQGDAHCCRPLQPDHSLPGQKKDVLLCKARPLTECKFEFNRIWGPNELESKKHVLQIASIAQLSESIFQVDLLAAAGTLPEYFAGQYLQLLIPGQDAAFFSIANAPGTRQVQLHIEVQPEQSSAVRVLHYLQKNATVKALLPMGTCFLAELPKAEVLLISAGTGFSQSKAIAEFLLNQHFSGPVTLYWGVRREQEMYAGQLAEQWGRENLQWNFVPVYADNPDNEWSGHHDELVKAVLDRAHKWPEALVYVSGSPAMVYTAMDALVPAGLSRGSFFSDVLEYAPRLPG